MVFSSLTFICVFLPVVYLLALILPEIRTKNILLALASLVFYAYGEPVYVILMIVSTVVNWLFGCFLMHAEHAKALAGAAVIINLGFLGCFKYAGMLVSSVNALFGTGFPEPDIALPIGISFYTFQAMSYIIDVYRGEVQVQTSYLKVLLYISFFPQLIAGPIVRYHEIEAQLDQRSMTLQDAAAGFRRFCFGLAKKVLISNTMGTAADAVFAASFGAVNIAGAWIGAISYLLQIYFDFSGYSDMAIGLARMFGFRYQENFRYPYAAVNIKAFWRRWHISLSAWFREYLYIPLGGNRKGRVRTVINKVIVFFCCGLWHGAAWTFVAWGLFHGFFSLLEEYLPIRKLPKMIGWIYTMLVVTLAFVIFRADTFSQGLWIISQMFTGFHFEFEAVSLAVQQLTPLFLVTLAVAVMAASPVKILVEKRALSSARAAVWETLSYLPALVLFVLSMLSLAGGGYNPFIYFRF